MNGFAIAVGENLELDMARAAQVLLDVNPRVAEGRFCLAANRADRRGKLGFLLDEAQALTAAAGRRLEHDRITDLRRGRAHLGLSRQRSRRPRHYRHPGRRHRLARLDLVAHAFDRFGRRADEHQAGIGHGAREAGIFREEAVAGMDRFRTGLFGGLEDPFGLEVTLRGGRRSNGDRVIGFSYVQRRAIGL